MFEEPQDVFCFLFVSLLVGAVVSYISIRSDAKLPYTVVVFVIGVIFSICFNYVHSHDVLKASIELWDRIDPNIILFAFLPALLFGEAMSLNFHHVRGALASSILLAGPGALFGTFAIGALAKYALPYNWPWGLSLVFGAILCATDPVAVVALLKKAGASRKLTYLIIGEALLNDGTALVLYNLLLSLVTIHDVVSITPMNVFIYFVKVILVSPVVGIAFGAVSLLFMGLANRRMEEGDTTIQMAVTLCCAYLSFFVAEEILGVSGVICCCAAGVTLAYFAPPLILHQHTLHSIWSALEWIGNTLIFTLAGLIIGARSVLYIEGRDVAYIFVTYLFITIVRMAMMVICYPVLARIGKKTTVQEAVFVTWGGLRGAVSMALALSLSQQAAVGNTNLSAADAHRVFLLVGGTAALTLIVNATLSGWVLKLLGLVDSDTNENTHIMYHYVKKRIHKRATQLLEQHCNRPVVVTSSFNSDGKNSDPVRYVCNKQLVYQHCSILRVTELGQEHRINASPSKGTNPLEDLFQSFPVIHVNIEDEEALLPPDEELKDSELKGTQHRAAFRRQACRRQNSVLHSFYHPASSIDHREAIPQLLILVRHAFLEVVRVNYWSQINAGKLPRKSSATLALLSSIDVALEAANEKGLCDWDVLTKGSKSLLTLSPSIADDRQLLSIPPNSVFDNMREASEENRAALATSAGFCVQQTLSDLGEAELPDESEQSVGAAEQSDTCEVTYSRVQQMRHRTMSVMAMPDHNRSRISRRTSGTHSLWQTVADTMQEYRVAKKVYLLTSFIEAHEYAQKKIPFYLGESEGIDTPEERLVVEESREQVRAAQALLAQIDANVITLQVSKQVARCILYNQQDMIEEFHKEGILLEKDASLLLTEVQGDLNALGNVEWSAILLSKVLHKLEGLLWDLCYGYCVRERRNCQEEKFQSSFIDSDVMRAED